MSSFSTPSRNPADQDSLPGLLDVVLQKFLEDVDDALPAQVIAVRGNRVTVQALIKMVDTQNQLISRSQIASVGVLQIGLGGFVMRFPPKKGDTGWIKAADRDISLFRQSMIESPPNTKRKHKFSDGFFIPDTMNQAVIAAEDNNNAVFQNLAGTVKIALWSNLIKIIAPAVGIGGTPNANAVLDLQSTTKAFIFPRMTTAQRNAIPSPVEGMTIWNLDTHGTNSYNGSAWV